MKKQEQIGRDIFKQTEERARKEILEKWDSFERVRSKTKYMRSSIIDTHDEISGLIIGIHIALLEVAERLLVLPAGFDEATEICRQLREFEWLIYEQMTAKLLIEGNKKEHHDEE